MQDSTEFIIYKALLQLLNEPAVLTSVGGVFITLGSMLNKSIRSILSGLFGKLASWASKPAGDQVHVLTDNYSQSAQKVNELVNDLRDTLDCSRVTVLQFHNGARFSLSNPIFKMSTAYEATDKGITSCGRAMREMIVSMNTNFICPLLGTPNIAASIPGVSELDSCQAAKNNGTCSLAGAGLRILKFKRDEMPFANFRFTLTEIGTEALYAILLEVKDKGPIAVLTIQFYEDGDSQDVIGKHVCDICAIKHQLQQLLYLP